MRLNTVWASSLRYTKTDIVRYPNTIVFGHSVRSADY